MTTSRIDARFEAWRTRGEADALAEVFDALAPGLLRLAIHLVGDASAAEDLVQQTFVTAMERAAGWDERRPLEPWLQGILANHARDLRKSARRAHDPNFDLGAVLARAEDAPLESASRRELSGELARAVDALEEPYRAAVLLRLRHGMEAADIAHVLGRSPGAVRVQLHRARELLKRALPAGIAGALVALALPARGLETVRDQVLEHAARLAPAAGVGGGLLGGVLVMKKLVVVSVLALAGLVAFRAVQRAGGAGPAPSEPARAELVLAAGVDAPRDEAARALAVEPRIEVAEAPAVASGTQRFAGRVLASPDGTPVAGARVELHALARRPRAEFERRWAGRVQPASDGWLSPAGLWRSRVKPDLHQVAGLEPLPDVDAPSGAQPFAVATTDAAGRFELAGPDRDALVVVAAGGYVTRRHPWLAAAAEHGAEEGAERELWVARAARLAARLVDESGAPVERRARITLTVHTRFELAPPGVQRRHELQAEAVDVETDDAGRFALDLGAEVVFAWIQDPTLGVRGYGRANAGGAIEPRPWLGAADRHGGDVLVVRPTRALRVLDAETGAPIERFHLAARELDGRFALQRPFDGWFSAPLGLLRITPDLEFLQESDERSPKFGPWTCRVWAPGFAPHEYTVEDALAAVVDEVRLQRAEPTRVAGRVTRAGQPAAGVPVILVAGGPGRAWETPSEEPGARGNPLAAARTDADGRFALEVLAGRHLVLVGRGEERVAVPVEAPETALEVELAQSARIRARVVLPGGAPAVGRPVHVRRPDDGRIEGVTDARGEYVTPALGGGLHVVTTSAVDALDVRKVDAEARVETVPGTEIVVDLALPADVPVYGRLVLGDGSRADAWRANVRGWTDSRVAVETGGRVPIDLREAGSLEFHGPDGRAVILGVPHDAREGHEFQIDVGGRGYAGVLTRLDDGRPIARVQVLAYLRDRQGQGMHSVTTDAQGRFRLLGLEDAPYRIVFDSQAANGVVENMVVLPDAAPSDPPRRLDLALPVREKGAFAGLPNARLRGKLTWEGQEVEGVQSHLAAQLDVPGGKLHVAQVAILGPDGRYDVVLPLGRSYSAWFWQSATDAKQLVRWDGSGAAVEEHDVALP